VSGHGFGHASRVIEVMNALADRRPDLPIIVRTSAARRLFELTLRRPVEFHEVVCDTGVVQVDSLTVDVEASIRRAGTFYRDLAEHAEREAAFLRSRRPAAVVADIPPLAFAAAALAGTPSIALGNFTWDWIYQGYAHQVTREPELVPAIRRAYANTALALRLPMWGGFEPMRQVVRDVPFVARRSRREPVEIRRALGIREDRPLVLMSFGGYGLAAFDARPLGAMDRYTFVTTDSPAGVSAGNPESPAGWDAGNVVRLDETEMYRAGCRYEDLVRASDVVITKPGYGIIAEAVANQTAILYTSRGAFAEYEVLVEQMPRFARSRFINQSDLLAGRWESHLDRLLAQPPPPETPSTDGAEEVAAAICGFLS
jgi:hypothetical protein